MYTQSSQKIYTKLLVFVEKGHIHTTEVLFAVYKGFIENVFLFTYLSVFTGFPISIVAMTF